MKKIYLGSSKLNNNFKMFRVKYKSRQEMEQIKPEIMLLMNNYLEKYGGYALLYAANSSTSQICPIATSC